MMASSTTKGEYGLTEVALDDLIGQQIPRITAGRVNKRVLLYAHGGLVSEPTAVQHAANTRSAALDAEVHPLNFWRSDIWSTIRNILSDAFSSRRDEAYRPREGFHARPARRHALEPVGSRAWRQGRSGTR